MRYIFHMRNIKDGVPMFPPNNEHHLTINNGWIYLGNFYITIIEVHSKMVLETIYLVNKKSLLPIRFCGVASF